MYVPLTMEDSIIVDGVLAPCYTFVPNNLAHIGMIPARWFPYMIEQKYGENNRYQEYG